MKIQKKIKWQLKAYNYIQFNLLYKLQEYKIQTMKQKCKNSFSNAFLCSVKCMWHELNENI